MKQSMRAKRMARIHRRMHKTSKLNLVSLMDIFTILVFFLMVNSSEVQVLQGDKSIKLPESAAEKIPRETLVIILNDRELLVQGRKLLDVKTIINSSGETIKELEQELKYQASRKPLVNAQEIEKGRAITIMGDKKIPYSLLKKVMSTCANTDYRNISLAVSKISKGSIGSGQEG